MTLTNLATLLAEVNALASSLKRGKTNFLLQLLHHHGPQTVPEIARRLSTSRQHIQLWVNRMKLDGHLNIRPNPAHQRSVLVEISDEGKLFLTHSAQFEQASLKKLSSFITETEAEAATAVLRRIQKSLTVSNATQKHGGAVPMQRTKTPKPARPKESPPPSLSENDTLEEGFPMNLL